MESVHVAPNIASLQKDSRFEGWLLVRGAEQRTSSNNKQYLDLTLSDRSGTINAKMWDGTVPPPPQGAIVRVRGTGNEFNGRMQLRIERIQVKKPDEEMDMSLLVPSAPEDSQRMLEEIRQTVAAFSDSDLQLLVGRLLDDAGETLLTFPAAQKMHHALRGGLLYHTLTMLRAAKALAPVYPFLNTDLLYSGVIIHDLAKISEMRADDMGVVKDYTVEGKLLGHIMRGVINIERAALETGADLDKALLLQHMVLSHHEKPEYGSPQPPKFPEAEVLSTLDTLDARLWEMLEALQRTLEGGFSERVWAMENRQLYRIPGADVGEDA